MVLVVIVPCVNKPIKFKVFSYVQYVNLGISQNKRLFQHCKQYFILFHKPLQVVGCVFKYYIMQKYAVKKFKPCGVVNCIVKFYHVFVVDG